MHLAIISSQRAGNVPRLEKAAEGLNPVWYVGDGEGGEYRHMGAERVVEAGSLCRARNRALDDADGDMCVEISDDVKRIGWADDKTTVRPITLAATLQHLADALEMTGAHLAGVAPTANPFYSSPRIHPTGFIVGDLIAVAPRCGLRFDETFTLKEDYDYTAQHLAEHGQVARLDQIMATFEHRTNRGGAVAYRTTAEEQDNIVRLKAKWPEAIRDNPRRPNEILFRWPKMKTH